MIMIGKPMKTLLILGGTAEARALADAAISFRLKIITSYAGLTSTPVLPSGLVRRGGFGGCAGLQAYLVAAEIDMIIDATHPYATQISINVDHAAMACKIPLLVLQRPPWQCGDGAFWCEVDSAAAAARMIKPNRRLFVALGGRDLDPFKQRSDLWLLLRRIEPASTMPTPHNGDVIIGHPGSCADEIALLQHYRINTLIARNSGGDAARGKLDAAGKLGLEIFIMRRPVQPSRHAPCVATVAAALDWLAQQTLIVK